MTSAHRIHLSIACALSCVAATGSMASAAEARRPKCPTEGKRVMAVSKRASVFVSKLSAEAGRPYYYGCDRRTRRIVSLNDAIDSTGGFGVTESAEPPILNGRFVAFSLIITDRDYGAPINVIRAYDLASRRRILDEPQYVFPGTTDPGSGAGRPTGLQINRRGDVAWISRHGAGDPLIDVRYAPRGRLSRLLSQSATVDTSSLALGDSIVYWSDGGPRSATR